MAKKKPKPFRVTKAVKSAAREAIGSPPPGRVIEERPRRAKEKHKTTLSKLLQDAGR